MAIIRDTCTQNANVGCNVLTTGNATCQWYLLAQAYLSCDCKLFVMVVGFCYGSYVWLLSLSGVIALGGTVN